MQAYVGVRLLLCFSERGSGVWRLCQGDLIIANPLIYRYAPHDQTRCLRSCVTHA
jgi:hypothetical protein